MKFMIVLALFALVAIASAQYYGGAYSSGYYAPAAYSGYSAGYASPYAYSGSYGASPYYGGYSSYYKK